MMRHPPGGNDKKRAGLVEELDGERPVFGLPAFHGRGKLHLYGLNADLVFDVPDFEGRLL